MGHPTGLVSRIERFATHDGPGIRTLVIMKGCPLQCRWCSSPYTQKRTPELLFVKSRCQACGQCITTCPEQSVSPAGNHGVVRTDRSLCTACGECIGNCPGQARQLSGEPYTVDELFGQIQKDCAFYRRSGGGITVGGGEPAMQPGFVKNFLSLCQSGFIHTAMETTAYAPWEKLAPMLECLDMIFVDLKHMDEKLHQQWTGVSNRLILENTGKISRQLPLILRIPVVPGFNDTQENILASARFATQLGSRFQRIELLPYHQFGLHQYEELERENLMASVAPPSGEKMERLRDIALSQGIEAVIGA